MTVGQCSGDALPNWSVYGEVILLKQIYTMQMYKNVVYTQHNIYFCILKDA